MKVVKLTDGQIDLIQVAISEAHHAMQKNTTLDKVDVDGITRSLSVIQTKLDNAVEDTEDE